MKTAAAIVLIVVVLLGGGSAYQVTEGQHALLLQFGRVVRADVAPGLHFKLPWLQQVVRVDDRLLELDAAPERYLTAGGNSVQVDFYVKWRVADAKVYYRATGGDAAVAAQRLTPIVKDALRGALAARSLAQLIADAGGQAGAPARQAADAAARRTLGLAVSDLRIKRLELPDQVSDAVYKRMRAERLQRADQLRAQGQEAAAGISADAKRQSQDLRADAERDAARVRGEGDAQAAAIYAQAAAADPEFFAFYRSLEAYRTAFGSGRSVIVLKGDAPFLKYFDDPGKGR